MKLSNEKLINTVNVFSGLNNAQLPIRVAYAISKNIIKIENEIKIYNIERNRLLERYSEKDEEGNIASDEHGNVTIKEEFREDWNRDIKELLAIENEIDIHTIQLDDLLGSNYSISPAELSLIDFMIND